MNVQRLAKSLPLLFSNQCRSHPTPTLDAGAVVLHVTPLFTEHTLEHVITFIEIHLFCHRGSMVSDGPHQVNGSIEEIPAEVVYVCPCVWRWRTGGVGFSGGGAWRWAARDQLSPEFTAETPADTSVTTALCGMLTLSLSLSLTLSLSLSLSLSLTLSLSLFLCLSLGC